MNLGCQREQREDGTYLVIRATSDHEEESDELSPTELAQAPELVAMAAVVICDELIQELRSRATRSKVRRDP